MNVELTVLIGVCGTVIGAVLGILGYRRNARRDIAAEAKDGGVMMMELRYIREGVRTPVPDKTGTSEQTDQDGKETDSSDDSNDSSEAAPALSFAY